MTETPDFEADRGETAERQGDPVLDADRGAEDRVESAPLDADQEDAELTD